VAQHAMVFWGMLSFVGILTVAYVYALKKGALRWDN
jgi:NADH:ubiquinone oxidoreductase subunit 3 (subunit A)